jgi:hypothetical protein
MAPVVRRSELVTEVRRYGHLEHLTHVVDSEIEARLDRSYRRLRALLDQQRGHELEKKQAQLHVEPDEQWVELPADFHQLRNLLIQRAVFEEGRDGWGGTGDFEEVLEFGERDRVELLNTRNPQLPDYRYRLCADEVGLAGEPRDQIELLPIPTEDLWLTVVYLPSLTLQTVLIDDVSDAYYMGIKGLAEEWLICDVLLTVKAKTDQEVAAWERRKAEVFSQLMAQATDRDAAQPAAIRKVWHRTDRGRHSDRMGGPWWRRGR